MNKQIELMIRRISNIHLPGDKQDIFIFTTPRSGSTFLMELIHTQKGIKFCTEPLNARLSYNCKAIGIDGCAGLLPSAGRDEKILKYFINIKRNRYAFFNQNPLRKNYRFVTDRIVYKVLHGAEDMMDTVRKRLNSKIVYLLRHPIAVTLSRKTYPRLKLFLQNEKYRTYFTKEQRFLAEEIIQKGDDFEQGIVSWCLQNRPSLMNPDRKNWLILCYEDLVENPQKCIQHLYRELDLMNIQKMLKGINQPSYTVDRQTKAFFKQKSGNEDRLWLIKKWKQRITDEQETRAFEILKAFDIDVYEKGEFMPTAKYRLPEIKVKP